MVCCGEKRAMLAKAREKIYPQEQSGTVYFQYTGRRGINVIGRVTHSLYRFESSGTVVAVDVRDQLALKSVPNLRQVKSP
jgi:hypothetical protein